MPRFQRKIGGTNEYEIQLPVIIFAVLLLSIICSIVLVISLFTFRHGRL